MSKQMSQQNHRWRRPQLEPTFPAPPLGSAIDTINVTELSKPASVFASSARVTECSLLASYNWLDKAKPTILIPGAPARWTPLNKPVLLQEDSGVFYRDKNASRYPTHPMEPTIRAVMAMHPEPPAKEIDVVACGSTLGNLLRFVRGDERPFRMLVEVVGNTVHLLRRENSPKETIQGIRGYGHTFPEAYTTWDASARGSASHQRILQYSFGGLSCLVRHEGDGYLKEKLAGPGAPERQTGSRGGSVEELIASLGDSKMTSMEPNTASQLQLQSGGFEVPQSAVFDLKTRSNFRRGRDILSDELPRMRVAQIPNFVLAYHDRGVFNDIEIMDVSAKVNEWENEKNKELSQLAALLHRVIELARDHGRLEISRQLPEKLDILNQTPDMPAVCSPDVLIRWGDWLHATAPSSDDEDGDVGGSVVNWSDSDEGEDFTACSEDCSYCGRCTY